MELPDEITRITSKYGCKDVNFEIGGGEYLDGYVTVLEADPSKIKKIIKSLESEKGIRRVFLYNERPKFDPNKITEMEFGSDSCAGYMNVG